MLKAIANPPPSCWGIIALTAQGLKGSSWYPKHQHRASTAERHPRALVALHSTTPIYYFWLLVLKPKWPWVGLNISPNHNRRAFGSIWLIFCTCIAFISKYLLEPMFGCFNPSTPHGDHLWPELVAAKVLKRYCSFLDACRGGMESEWHKTWA